MTCTIDSLPNETLDKIFELCRSPPPSFGDLPFCDSEGEGYHATLLSCVLVCKRWNNVATPVLQRCIAGEIDELRLRVHPFTPREVWITDETAMSDDELDVVDREPDFIRSASRPTIHKMCFTKHLADFGLLPWTWFQRAALADLEQLTLYQPEPQYQESDVDFSESWRTATFPCRLTTFALFVTDEQRYTSVRGLALMLDRLTAIFESSVTTLTRFHLKVSDSQLLQLIKSLSPLILAASANLRHFIFEPESAALHNQRHSPTFSLECDELNFLTSMTSLDVLEYLPDVWEESEGPRNADALAPLADHSAATNELLRSILNSLPSPSRLIRLALRPHMCEKYDAFLDIPALSNLSQLHFRYSSREEIEQDSEARANLEQWQEECDKRGIRLGLMEDLLEWGL